MQRGYYSELLGQQDGGAPLGVQAKPRLGAPKQKPPAARLFTGQGAAAAADPAAETAESDPAAVPAIPEPKVYVAHKQELGAMPRRVVVERQRRLFSEQDVPSLLAAVGVDFRYPEMEAGSSILGVVQWE